MLTDDELSLARQRMGRKLNFTEIAVFDSMWSEHCSYKSSKRHLSNLYTHNENVLYGPGENAGVIDFGDGDKIAFKMESHNHPSFIEPYQGAATGAGGIIRDVFTMGFRPIALTNNLFFGPASMPENVKLANGVVRGLSDYGNCVGIPTISSHITVANCYTQNPLVNAMCVGYTNGPVFTNTPATTGDVYYVGAKTGRDGIGGAVMASETMDDGINKRPAVQVGDPYLEKLLIEASLELFATGKVIAAQDMGAAGITSSATEIALRGGLGMRLDLSNVPLREQMQPWEILLSESQERMLFVLNKDAGEDVFAIFKKWDLDCQRIGELVEGSSFVVSSNGDTYCDIPLQALEPPVLDRTIKPRTSTIHNKYVTDSDEYSVTLFRKQFDQEVMGNTVRGIHNDFGLIKLPNSNKGVAIITASHPYLCSYHTGEGIRHSVDVVVSKFKEHNIKPMALTNCLNFGNPEDPFVMYDFVDTTINLDKVARYYDLPIVSGNVSLYNETAGNNILPTPVIGCVGLVEDIYNV